MSGRSSAAAANLVGRDPLRFRNLQSGPIVLSLFSSADLRKIHCGFIVVMGTCIPP